MVRQARREKTGKKGRKKTDKDIQKQNCKKYGTTNLENKNVKRARKEKKNA